MYIMLILANIDGIVGVQVSGKLKWGDLKGSLHTEGDSLVSPPEKWGILSVVKGYFTTSNNL